MSEQDPPLYGELRAAHDLTPRHRLREDHVPLMTPDPDSVRSPWADSFRTPEPHPHAEVYGLAPDHVYGSDDDPAGPPAPPLQREVLDAGELPHRFYPETGRYPRMVPADAPVVACPTCGSGVDPDRLRG